MTIQQVTFIKQILTEGCVSPFPQVCLWAEAFVLYFTCVQRLVNRQFQYESQTQSFLEIHQFMNKTLIRFLLRIHPFNSTKATTCPSEGMKLCTHFPNTHLQDWALLKLGESKCLPLRYDHISAVAVALWHYLIDACLGTQYNSANVWLTVTTWTSYRYSYISIYLPN